MNYTVVIPSRNRSDLLLRALRSVHAQTCPAAQILVVDDGSDEPIQLPAEFHDARTTILRHERPMGGPTARNLGLDHAAHEVLALLDDDDEWLPRKMELQLEYLRAHPDCPLVSCGYLRVQSGATYRDVVTEEFLYRYGQYDSYIASFSFMALRRDTRHGFLRMDPKLPAFQDWDYYLKLCRRGPIGMLSEPLGIYHAHEEARITTKGRNRLLGLRRCFFQHRKELTPDARRWVLSRMIFDRANTSGSFLRKASLVVRSIRAGAPCELPIATKLRALGKRALSIAVNVAALEKVRSYGFGMVEKFRRRSRASVACNEEKSILFIDQSGEIAGGQVVLQALIKVVREDGWRVGVLAPGGGSLHQALRENWGAALAIHDLKPLALTSRSKRLSDLWALLRYCTYVFRFRALLKRYRVIYVNGARLAVSFFILSLLSPRQKWFYHLHLCHSRLEKWIFNLIAASGANRRLVMASEFIHENFAGDHPRIADGGRCRVLRNCLDESFAKLPFTDRFTNRTAPFTVALVGRVVAYKGHEVLLGLARRFPQVRFVMVGAVTVESGSLLSEMLEHRLPNLEYLGETRDLPRLLERLPVQFSIVPSRWEEPFGLTAIESMAASCITLVSDRGMLPRIAKLTGASCFHSDDELGKMLAVLLAQPASELGALAHEQHQRTLEQFGFEKFRDGLLTTIVGD